ncbi:MAG: hypothetical protein JW384_00137 [Nitrosomonadaceae bacterium]|nr:hypothetical protein [Nitrosomonadaceae bacterium]
MTHIKSRAKFIVFSLLPALLIFLMIESGSYVYYRFNLLDDFMPIDISDSFHSIPDLFETRKTENGEVLFSRYFPTRYYVSERNYRGKTMVRTKTAKTFRIFSFGGSSTAGSPWGHEASFSRFLEDELNAIKHEGTSVEVINFGGAGYGSTRVLGLVKASIEYQPDLIVVYSGHNELWDNHIYLDLAQNEAAAELRRLGDMLYAVRVGRKLIEMHLIKPPQWVDLLKDNSTSMPARLKDNQGFKTSERRYLAAQFKQNMRDIVQIARLRNVPVLLVSQPSNFFYQPSWYPAKGEEQQAKLVDELRGAHERHYLEVARMRANEILALNAENGVAHFYLGLLDKVRGDFRNARAHFLAAIDFDEKPERYTRAYRTIQQELENPAAGVYFVDAWKAAGDFLDDGLQDGRLFVDKMHPIVECNKLIAWTIERDYFARHQVRTDLFDYSKVDPTRVWETNLKPDFYLMICARYFKISDPSLCVPEMFQRYSAMADDTGGKGIFRISWEYLFYYGLLTHETSWFDKSESVYKGRSLEAIRAREMKPKQIVPTP